HGAGVGEREPAVAVVPLVRHVEREDVAAAERGGEAALRSDVAIRPHAEGIPRGVDGPAVRPLRRRSSPEPATVPRGEVPGGEPRTAVRSVAPSGPVVGRVVACDDDCRRGRSNERGEAKRSE
ncbi:MAG: hypothetical protein ACK56I_11645, partial [bacterium]